MRDPRSVMARFFELPEEILLDLPKITVIGDAHVLIENHRGLVRFHPERVTVETTRGPFTVNGTDLQIASVDRETLSLTGVVRSLVWRG